MRKRLFGGLGVLLAGLLVFSSMAPAQHSHGGSMGESMKMDTKEVLVEGMKITFAFMANKEHKKML